MHRLPVLVASLALFTATAHGQWPQWRGPARDGVVPAASVPAAWPDKLSPGWRQAIGEGYSSPVVDDGRVFVLSRSEPDEVVSAFELESGEPIWSARYPSSFTKNQYATMMSKGPFSTPLVAGGRIFTLGVSAVLSSFDVATGTLKWRKDWSKEIDTSKLFTGSAMSPIIDSGLLIVHVGDDMKGAFRAFDPATGDEKWSLPGHGPGYASPVALAAGGARQLVTMTDKAVVGVEVATGKLLWQIPFPDDWNENIITPVVAGDLVIISGVRKGTFGYRLEAAGSTWTPREVWHNADVSMYMSTPVADGDYLYGFSNKRKGQIVCLDRRTGALKWATEGRSGMNAAIQSAGPNLLVLTTEGELIVAPRSPEKFEELRRYKVADGQTWAHPVVLGTRVVIRDAGSVAVWSLK